MLMKRTAILFALILGGEAVFVLPFIVTRVFRPTLLDVFRITNFELGAAFALYGVVAMFSYFLGGPLADRFSGRRLMAAALLATSSGGVYFATVPNLVGLKFLFAFWGMTTILIFWAALLRAIREFGGEVKQATAFGILDSGRGLLSALLATVTVLVFAALLPTDASSATLPQRTDALQQVIWICTGVTAAAAGIVWICVPDSVAIDRNQITLRSILKVTGDPAVWLQGVIVVCAYTCFKGTDDFSLYARDAFGFDDVSAASVVTLTFWVRPAAAVAIGILGDRIGSSRAILICFGALVVGNAVLALGLLRPSIWWLFYFTLLGNSIAIYGLRGVYFALFREAQVPLPLTGTVIGTVSFIGYTPDIFAGPLMGYLTDTYPGALGHQYFFGILSAIAALGAIATILFRYVASRTAKPDVTT